MQGVPQGPRPEAEDCPPPLRPVRAAHTPSGPSGVLVRGMGYVTFDLETDATHQLRKRGHVVQDTPEAGSRDWSFVNPLVASGVTPVYDGERVWDLREDVPGVRTRGPGSGWKVYVERGLGDWGSDSGGGNGSGSGTSPPTSPAAASASDGAYSIDLEWKLATKRLGDDLEEIDVLLPPHATGAMRKWSAVFLSFPPPDAYQAILHNDPSVNGWEDDGTIIRDGMGDVVAHVWSLHGDAGPSRGMVVDVCVRRYASADHTTYRPASLLHEFCHIFHALFSERVDPVLKVAYGLSLAEGLWEKPAEVLGHQESLRLPGQTPGAEMASNLYRPSMPEYFAWCCAAYFSSTRFFSDAFPYVAAELRVHDPVGEALVELAFEIVRDDVHNEVRPSMTKFPALWISELSSVFKEHRPAIRQVMSELGDEKQGRFDVERLEEIYGRIFDLVDEDAVTRRRRRSQLRAAMAAVDVDHDLRLSHNEFIAWLVMVEEGVQGRDLEAPSGPERLPEGLSHHVTTAKGSSRAQDASARKKAAAASLVAQFEDGGAGLLHSVIGLDARGGGGLDSAFSRIAAERRVKLVLADPDPNTWGGLGTRPDTADPRRLRPQTPLVRPTSAAPATSRAQAIEIVTPEDAQDEGVADDGRVEYDPGAGVPRTPPRPRHTPSRPAHHVRFMATP